MGWNIVHYGRLLFGGELIMLGLLLSVIVSLHADFTQTKHIAMMREPQVSTGHLVYRAPDYLQWNYLTPQQQVWETDGGKSNVNPQIQRLLHVIMESISGASLRDNGDFDVSNSGNIYTLLPKRRDYKHLFRKIVLTMDETNGIAQRVEMQEANGNQTIIEFSNVTTQ